MCVWGGGGGERRGEGRWGGVNGPLIHYFSQNRGVCNREKEKEAIMMDKKGHYTASAARMVGSCPAII